jgi:hypothetical protein
MQRFQVRDTVLLSGWLFADLLLGLAIIFFVSLPGSQQPPPPILKWQVTPTSLTQTSHQCAGPSLTALHCTVVISESADSQASLPWTASSDMGDASNPVTFSQSSGTLQPGQSVTITISTFPCQNGSFIFTGPSRISPLIVLMHCTLPSIRLERAYKHFNLNVKDIPGLLNNSQAEINDIKQQVRGQSLLKNRRVGLALVYGEARNDGEISQAVSIASAVYNILRQLGNEGFAFEDASYFDPLFIFGSAESPNQVVVDVYLFTQ